MRTPFFQTTVADATDEPLPLTLRFTLILGAGIAIGWFLMFALLQRRW